MVCRGQTVVDSDSTGTCAHDWSTEKVWLGEVVICQIRHF